MYIYTFIIIYLYIYIYSYMWRGPFGFISFLAPNVYYGPKDTVYHLTPTVKALYQFSMVVKGRKWLQVMLSFHTWG